MKWWTLLGVFFLVPFQCGGGCGPAPSDPCEQDRQGCAPSPGLPMGVECAAEPVLAVELGTGQSSFQALEPGKAPELFYGEQGGVHTFGSVRVTGAQLDRYDQLELVFSIQSPCSTADGFACPDEFRDVEVRTALVGGEVPLNVAGGVVEETGFLIFAETLAYERDTPHRLRVEVRDPCGRRAEALHEIAAASGG